MCAYPFLCISFFIIDTAPIEIYTLSLHDALPIYPAEPFWVDQRHDPALGYAKMSRARGVDGPLEFGNPAQAFLQDRKSTRLNSSHLGISYAVFCLKKKKIYAQLANTVKQSAGRIS